MELSLNWLGLMVVRIEWQVIIQGLRNTGGRRILASVISLVQVTTPPPQKKIRKVHFLELLV